MTHRPADNRLPPRKSRRSEEDGMEKTKKRKTYSFRKDNQPKGHQQSDGMRVFAIRLRPETYEALKEAAQQENVALSAAARFVIEGWAQRSSTTA